MILARRFLAETACLLRSLGRCAAKIQFPRGSVCGFSVTMKPHAPIGLRPALVGSLLLIGSVVSSALGAEAPWKAGFAAVKITPAEPLMLAGYASRTIPATAVLDDQ